MNRQTLVAAKSAAQRFVQEADLLLASKETYYDEGSRLQPGPWEYGGQPRLHAIDAVLDHQAIGGCRAQRCGGMQEQVGRRLGLRHMVGAIDMRIKQGP